MSQGGQRKFAISGGGGGGGAVMTKNDSTCNHRVIVKSAKKSGKKFTSEQQQQCAQMHNDKSKKNNIITDTFTTTTTTISTGISTVTQNGNVPIGTSEQEDGAVAQQPAPAPAPAPPPPIMIVDYGNGETIESYEHSYIDSDGTRVTKRTTIRRMKPDCTYVACSSSQSPQQPVTKSTSLDTLNPDQLSTFEAQFLARHNECRAAHRTPPLVMSRRLCRYAQQWADHLAQHRVHQHRPSPKKYGENIFWKSSPSMRLAGAEAVDSWYEECASYDRTWYGGDPPRTSYKVSGHFTQLVWRATTHLGVGVAINGESFYVVANYHPIGNCFTRYGANVLAPISLLDSSSSNGNNNNNNNSTKSRNSNGVESVRYVSPN